MSMVEPIMGWPELVQLYGPLTAYTCQQALDSVWLLRYPRHEEIGMYNDGEFKKEFTDLCNNMGLKKKPSNSWNPQSNVILERIHQVFGDGLRSFDLDNKDIDPEDDDPYDEYISCSVCNSLCIPLYSQKFT